MDPSRYFNGPSLDLNGPSPSCTLITKPCTLILHLKLVVICLSRKGPWIKAWGVLTGTPPALQRPPPKPLHGPSPTPCVETAERPQPRLPPPRVRSETPGSGVPLRHRLRNWRRKSLPGGLVRQEATSHQSPGHDNRDSRHDNRDIWEDEGWPAQNPVPYSEG